MEPASSLDYLNKKGHDFATPVSTLFSRDLDACTEVQAHTMCAAHV